MQVKSLWLLPLLVLNSHSNDLGFNDFLEVVSASSSGDSVDCGHIPLRAEGKAQKMCVENAFQKGEAFHITVQRQGVDSYIASGAVSDGAGNVFIFLFDSDPTGGNNKANGVIYRSHCLSPVVSQTMRPVIEELLACEDTARYRIPAGTYD